MGDLSSEGKDGAVASTSLSLRSAATLAASDRDTLLAFRAVLESERKTTDHVGRSSSST